MKQLTDRKVQRTVVINHPPKMTSHIAGVTCVTSSLGQGTNEGAVWCGGGALDSEDLGGLGSSLDSSINWVTETSSFSSLGLVSPSGKCEVPRAPPDPQAEAIEPLGASFLVCGVWCLARSTLR